MYNTTNLAILATVFILAGTYIGIVDSMERALSADLLPLSQRGTGYGALATVNSFGDLLSSILVGLLWNRISYRAGLSYAAVLTLLGSVLLFIWKPQRFANSSTE
jgi:MFS-type transporter involved in bile tolerance (Atg22 family)